MFGAETRSTEVTMPLCLLFPNVSRRRDVLLAPNHLAQDFLAQRIAEPPLMAPPCPGAP